MTDYKLVPVELLRDWHERINTIAADTAFDVADEMEAMLAAAPVVVPALRSDQEIIDQTEQVAAMLAAMLFCCEIDEGVLYRESSHPKAIACWRAACIAQEILTETDVENAVAMLECEDEHEQPVEHPAPDVAVPEGYAILPKELTADNGAKSILIGEFYSEIVVPCPDCEGG